jgi:hypothetical protein
LVKCRDNIPNDCAESTLKPDGKILTAFSEEIETLFFDRSKNLRQYQDEVADCVNFFGLAFQDLKEVPADSSRWKKASNNGPPTRRQLPQPMTVSQCPWTHSLLHP